MKLRGVGAVWILRTVALAGGMPTVIGILSCWPMTMRSRGATTARLPSVWLAS